MPSIPEDELRTKIIHALGMCKFNCDGKNHEACFGDGDEKEVDDVMAAIRQYAAKARQCFCVGVEFGTYDHVVSMKCPFIDRNNGWVVVDVCIATEIAELWHKGVKTLNSCCGHKKLRSSVIVDPKHDKLMGKLGYTYGIAPSGLREYYLHSGTQPEQLKKGQV